MKNLLLSTSFILAVSIFTACKKSNSDTPPPTNSGTALFRIQQGTDPDITNDTVYHIIYNADKKISMLVDSLANDTLVATYDGSGNLTAITDKGAYPINATLTYNSANSLTQVDYILAGSHERYTFEYNGSVVSKENYYSNLGAGSLTLQNYSTYTVSGGNVTGLTAFMGNGTPIGSATLTYGTQTNPFGNLCLFNYGNRLGMDNIAPIESYFNKNIGTGIVVFGVPAMTVTNTFDSKSQLGKIVANDMVNDELLTWQFYYK